MNNFNNFNSPFGFNILNNASRKLRSIIRVAAFSIFYNLVFIVLLGFAIALYVKQLNNFFSPTNHIDKNSWNNPVIQTVPIWGGYYGFTIGFIVGGVLELIYAIMSTVFSASLHKMFKSKGYRGPGFYTLFVCSIISIFIPFLGLYIINIVIASKLLNKLNDRTLEIDYSQFQTQNPYNNPYGPNKNSGFNPNPYPYNPYSPYNPKDPSSNNPKDNL